MRSKVLAVAVAVLIGAGVSDADERTKEPAKAKRDAAKEISWARSWHEARDEAAERNVLIFLHSHGST
jgi:hypothetical protein